MTESTVKTILNSKVISVENFQITTLSVNGIESGRQWTADFRLKGGQGFHVRRDKIGYTYVPVPEHNKLPKLNKIFWKEYSLGFGGRGCGFTTEVELTPRSSEKLKKAYEAILTPTEINEGPWVPYPDYRYVPMLATAFEINYAYKQKMKIAHLVQKANQNMADALALRSATYDLRQYCR